MFYHIKILLWNSDTRSMKINWPMQIHVLDFQVPCYNTKCSEINSIPTGKRHGNVWDANSKLATGKAQYVHIP